MADRDTVQLLVEVLGQEGIDRLARSTDNYKALLADLADKLKAGDVSAEEFTRTQAKLTAELEREQALLSRLRQTMDDASRTYDVLERQAGAYDLATDRTNDALDEQVRKATEATAAQRALGRALEDSGDRGARSNAKLGRSALEAGRALQDFAQGGVGGILNNIEGLTSALGGGPGLAGVMTAVGLAAYFAKPYIEKWVEGFGPVKEKIPEATDRIERLTESIKADAKAIEELKEKRELDFREMQKYVELTGKLNQAEADLATARKARSVGPGESRAQRERAGTFRDALAEYGGSDRLLGALQEAGVDPKQAEEMVANALEGARNPIAAIQRTLRGRKGQEFAYTDPEAAAQQKAIDAYSEQGAKEYADIRKAREKRAAEVRALEAQYLEGNQDIDFNDRQRRKKAAREVEALEAQYLEGNQDIDFNAQQRARREARRADSPAARRRAEKEARERQAAGLVANAPGIVGQAFGPQAAAMAANANPAEIQEMAERTARALEQGQAPYQAVLDAFRQVAAAAERNAAQTRQFYGQLNGLQGRMHRGMEQGPQPSGLQR